MIVTEYCVMHGFTNRRIRLIHWNIQYNSPLNLNYTKWTKAIAYADDLLIAVKAATIAEVENLTNTEMIKIMKWSKENKMQFNEQNSNLTSPIPQNVFHLSSSVHSWLPSCLGTNHTEIRKKYLSTRPTRTPCNNSPNL